MVNVVVLTCLAIPWTKPVGFCVWPMTEMSLICPYEFASHSTVIKAILTVFHGMDIKEDLYSIFVASIEHPLDLISSTIHAANIWSIWFKSPVTDWESHHFD